MELTKDRVGHVVEDVICPEPAEGELYLNGEMIQLSIFPPFN